jgi:hypothetical protein
MKGQKQYFLITVQCTVHYVLVTKRIQSCLEGRHIQKMRVKRQLNLDLFHSELADFLKCNLLNF